MADSADQIEKHTIVIRLSVCIYKMNDHELNMLLNLLRQENLSDLNAIQTKTPVLDTGKESHVQRQMIIAQLFILLKNIDKDTLLERLRSFDHPEFKWIREYPRLSCYLQVDFAVRNRAYRSTIRDISAGGVFIETSEPFEKGQEIALCFTLQESNENLPIKITGKVTRVYPDGIGVIYTNISNYQRDILNVLIHKMN
jgi:Tfp pilus assembly protein PilZ